MGEKPIAYLIHTEGEFKINAYVRISNGSTVLENFSVLFVTIKLLHNCFFPYVAKIVASSCTRAFIVQTVFQSRLILLYCRKKFLNIINFIVMKFRPEEAIKFTERSVALLVSWPPPLNFSKKKIMFLDVYFSISFLSAQTLLLVLFNGMYANSDNPEIMIQSTCTVIAIIQMSVKMMACRTQRSNLQSIVIEMESVIKQALPYERAILEKYVNRCAMLHIFLTFGFYLAGISIVLGPVVLPQPFPTFAVYPFDVESHPMYEIVYLQQAFSGVQASTGATIDCQVATLLWFAGARFEMLNFEVMNIKDECDLKECIIKHQQILRYSDNVVKTVRFVILATVGITAMLIVFSGLLFLFTDSTTIKFQFLVLDVVAIMQLFLTSYPAENLLEMSNAIGSAAYNSNWVNKSPQMWKNICVLIQRSQKSVNVSVGGFLPSLSLTYYMSFLSSSFSYFTTMRAMVN